MYLLAAGDLCVIPTVRAKLEPSSSLPRACVLATQQKVNVAVHLEAAYSVRLEDKIHGSVLPQGLPKQPSQFSA